MPNGNSSSATEPRRGVFISYARTDGVKFANRLRQKLEAEEIPLWQDLADLKGGEDWWLQIKEALDRVEFMALVITPNALKSEIVFKEWRYARRQGVCVFPIKGTRTLNFNSLPRWVRSTHFYDLGTLQNRLSGPEWQKFVNDLKTRCQIPRVPFMAEDIPEGFVPRQREFDQLRNLFSNQQAENSVGITAALSGAGGYGKTTLAKAICHDQAVQDAFDHGILWVSLGKNPGDLTGRVEDLIVTLGKPRPGFTTLETAVNRFKEILEDRYLLIVIDDVWDRAHLNPFTQGGPSCARLITTRNLDTLPANAIKVGVDAMQQHEATALLTADLRQTLLPHEGLSEIPALAAKLGEWPLLLRLVNGALRTRIENNKQSPADAIRWINKALDKRGPASFDAVASTIEVSLDLLKESERERYGELAIFPADVEIPVDVLEKLWDKTGGLEDWETEELCIHLNGISLLVSYDAERRYVRVHDVVRRFLIQQQRDKLASIHEQLLDLYRPAGSSGARPRWSEMSVDEPYLWQHLAHHLLGADHGEELVATVKDWRYLIAKTSMRKSFGVEADLLAAERFAGDDEPLRLLRRNFVNCGHLLNRCENSDDIGATLFSRLRDLPEMAWLTTDLEQHLKRPCILPTSKMPDLPHPALVRTVSGHEQGVRCCALSADGTTVISASDDETVKVFDGKSGAERFTLSAHAGWVNDCAVNSAGTTIVAALNDQTLKVWDGRTGAERFTLRGHTGGVNDCEVSADGRTIVSASNDQTLKVWDAETGAELLTLSGHAGGVTGCALSSNGETIVSGSNDQTLMVWDGKSGAARLTLNGHEGGVLDCAVSEDGTTIVSGSTDQTVKVWDGRTGKESFSLGGHAGGVIACALSADGETIVSTSNDQTLKVWDGRRGTERFTLSGHAGPVNDCSMSADGAVLVSASNDKTLKIWDVRSQAEDFPLDGYAGGMNDCAMSEDGTIIVSASDDQTLKVWKRDGDMGLTLSGHAGEVSGCAISADGMTIISASSDQTLKVWDTVTGKVRVTLSGHTGRVNDCALSADGKTIISASDDGTLKVWGKSGKVRLTLTGHDDWVTGCAVSADGTTIVSASNDETLKVWNGRTGRERLTLKGHADQVRSCAVSADGATVVSASDDRTLKVWNGQKAGEHLTLNGHFDWVNDCAISPDGTTIISVSDDQTLRVWDTSTGKSLATLHVDGRLHGCAYSVAGDLIVATGVRGIYMLRLLR